MNLLRKNSWYLLLLFAFSLPARPQTIEHGTAIIVFFAEDGIVMASDGMSVREDATGNPAYPFIRSTIEAEPKVISCGKFLCGNAGNQLIFPTFDFEYHLQKLLPSDSDKARSTVREYAEVIRDKARLAFGKIDSVIKSPDFWSPEVSNSDGILLRIGIAGYSKGVPTYCQVTIGIDRENERFFVPDVNCKTFDIKPGNTRHVVLSGYTEVLDRAATLGTSENTRFVELLPDARATSRTLFPDAPRSVQEAIAISVVAIAMQGEFYPQDIGGTTRIGVLIKNKTPSVHDPIPSLSVTKPK